MRKTAMQNLKEDLLETIITGKEALDKIQDVNIKSACKTTLETTIQDIINRIDNELLEMEKNQILDAFEEGSFDIMHSQEYYDKTYTQRADSRP